MILVRTSEPGKPERLRDVRMGTGETGWDSASSNPNVWICGWWILMFGYETGMIGRILGKSDWCFSNARNRARRMRRKRPDNRNLLSWIDEKPAVLKYRSELKMFLKQRLQARCLNWFGLEDFFAEMKQFCVVSWNPNRIIFVIARMLAWDRRKIWLNQKRFRS